MARTLWRPRKEKYEITTEKLDEDIFLLEELLREEMYEQSEKSLYKFLVNFWNCHEPAPFKNNWHVECIAEHVQAALDRKIRRLVINISPRSGKSIVTSISSPVYQLINHPYEKFWLISHSAKLFTQNIVLARRIMEHPQYRQRWCNIGDPEHYRFRISGDVNLKTRVETDQGGYILGGSPTSTALGMGYSVAILDDVLDSEEANSPAAIQKVNDWYTQTFLNRSNDPKTDVVIIIMQRLAQADLTDYVLTKYGDQNWTHLNLPARYDPERTFISPIGYPDPRSKKNELMDAERLPDEFLIQQAKNPIIYNTRYQQNPEAITEGNLVKAEWFQETSFKPTNTSLMITVWDLSFTDSPSSTYSVGLVLCKFEDKVYIIDMFREQCDIPRQLEAIRHMKRKYPKAIVGVEKRANGHAVMSLLEREIKNIYAFEPRLFGGSKEQRLGSTLEYFRSKQVFFYNPFNTDEKLEKTYSVSAIKQELLGFPLASNDDIVDCISYGIQFLMEKEQETIAIITGGEKIHYSEEDYNLRDYLRTKYSGQSAFEDDSNFLNEIPSRDYMQSIDW